MISQPIELCLNSTQYSTTDIAFISIDFSRAFTKRTGCQMHSSLRGAFKLLVIVICVCVSCPGMSPSLLRRLVRWPREAVEEAPVGSTGPPSGPSGASPTEPALRKCNHIFKDHLSRRWAKRTAAVSPFSRLTDNLVFFHNSHFTICVVIRVIFLNKRVSRILHR